MSGPVRPPLTVETVDGATVGRPITKIKVSNGTLTVTGNIATITTGGSGGGGTVTSVNPKADSGTGTAITTTGSFEIKGGTGITTSINASNEITINGNTGTVTSVSGSAPVSSSGGTTPTISMSAADATTDGYLTSADWSTFNSKGSGTVTGSGADNQVAVWSGASAIGGSSTLTFDDQTLTLATASNDPKINMSSSTKSVTLLVDTNQKLKVEGSTNSFVFDASSASGGITWPDGTTQTTAATAAATYSIAAAQSGSDAEIQLDASTGTDTAVKLAAGSNITLTESGGDTITIAASGGSISFPIEADSGSTGAPSYSFSADTDTGIYLGGASNMGIVAGGNSYLSIGSLGAVQFDKKALFNAATEAAPNAFATDTDTGFYLPGADQLSFSIGGTRLFDFRNDSSSARFTLRGSAPYISCDDASADLSLRSGGGTYGEIKIQNENSDIEISPAGTGKVKISDAYTLPSSDGDANQVLQTDGSGALSFATVSGGGGSPGGSDTNVQFNDSSSFGGSGRFKFDPDVGGSGNAGMGLRSNSDAFLSSGFAAYIEGNAYISSQVFGNEFLCQSSSASDPGFGPSTDQNTGISFSAADQVDIVTGGTYNVSFGANKELLLGGTAAGTSGQVLTSGGAGAAISWADAGGGTSGAVTPVKPQVGNASSTTEISWANTEMPFGNARTTTQTINTNQPLFIPFIARRTDTLDKAYLYVSSAASSATDVKIGLYSNSNGAPGTLRGVATIDVSSTGTLNASLSAEAGQDLDTTAGAQYWIGVVRGSANDFTVGASDVSYSGSMAWRNTYNGSYGVLSQSGSDNNLPATAAFTTGFAYQLISVGVGW